MTTTSLTHHVHPLILLLLLLHHRLRTRHKPFGAHHTIAEYAVKIGGTVVQYVSDLTGGMKLLMRFRVSCPLLALSRVVDQTNRIWKETTLVLTEYR